MDALHVHRARFGLLLGHVLTELQELVVTADETDALLRLGLHRLPPTEFPRVAILRRPLPRPLAGTVPAVALDRGILVVAESPRHPRMNR